VVFAGPVDDAELLAWLAAADVGVLPSTLPSEAWGMVSGRDARQRRPRGLDRTGDWNVAREPKRETGLVVPPADSGALAAALNRLLDDQPMRRRMGIEGRARARSLFSREAMMLGVSSAYERAMSDGAGRQW